MQYRVEETQCGPDIVYNDWRIQTGRKERAGGAVHFFAEPKALVKWDTYPYGGGGDVETVLAFGFDRFGPDGRLSIRFNDRRRTRDVIEGFRVIIDSRHVSVYCRDIQIGQRPTGEIDRHRVVRVRLATLAESYALWLDDDVLAQGRMSAPFTDNEGDFLLELENADMRLLTFTERFIAADLDVPTWQRGELLYREAFGARSLAENWIVNKGEPGSGVDVVDGAFVFRHMSNSFIAQRFEGSVVMDCTATPVPTSEKSAGITDAIFIWMLDCPDGELAEFLAEQEGASLGNLTDLPFYWVDFGGTNNVTTRLRKNPRRHMIRQFTDRARLLERDRSYRVSVVQNGHFVEFWVDGKRWMAAYDPDPHSAGHVGFRAYCADLRVESIEVWRVVPPRR
ncbi:MAG: hypothetical protein HON70_40970 [Lentisphaerae bacterium]|nr:hypothetical protein [Lentisphaerota bacterium]